MTTSGGSPAPAPRRSHWSAPALTGKSIMLAGRMPAYVKKAMVALIESEEGRVVEELSPGVIVVVADGTTTPPPAVKKAEKLNAQENAGIEILSAADFQTSLVPTAEQLVEMLQAGAAGRIKWEDYSRRLGAKFNLRDADLRGLDLRELSLQNAIIDGADLRGADLTKTKGVHARGLKLDGATLAEVEWISLENCSLVGVVAPFSTFNSNFGVAQPCNADFTRATLTHALIQNVEGPEAKFIGADLSDACLRQSKFAAVNFSRANLQRSTIRETHCEGALFVGANLTGADVAGSSFQRSDFRDAVLRGVNFCTSDLSGADFNGADLTGANLTRTNVTLEQLAGAKGASVAAPASFKPRPLLKQLDAQLSTLSEMNLACQVAARFGVYRVILNYQKYRGPGRVCSLLGFLIREQGPLYAFVLDGDTFASAFPTFLDYLGPDAKILAETVVRSGGPLKSLPSDALFEAFGQTPPTTAERTAHTAAAKEIHTELKRTLLAELRGGPEGIATFNARPARELINNDHFKNANLANAVLDGLVTPPRCLFTGANFDGASLLGVTLDRADLTNATFNGATIRKAKFDGVMANASFTNAVVEEVDFSKGYFHKASFNGATLTRCTLSNAFLMDADFSQATCIDCNWNEAHYNERTQLPTGFAQRQVLTWRGRGLPPHELAAERAREQAALAAINVGNAGASTESDTASRERRRAEFMDRLKATVAKSKVDNAIKMLKAEKFELFVDVNDKQLAGVVRSQSDPDLVYVCKLASDGKYSCCTHKLNACGGLRGSPCKHLLVLAIGLERNDAVAPETLGLWLVSTRNRPPELNKEQMAELLIRYKGAEAGEIDWRPTETTPEDFYAM